MLILVRMIALRATDPVVVIVAMRMGMKTMFYSLKSFVSF